MNGEIRMGFVPLVGGPVAEPNRWFLVLDSGATYALDNPAQVSAALAVPQIGSAPIGDLLRERVRELEHGLAAGTLVHTPADPLGQLVPAPQATAARRGVVLGVLAAGAAAVALLGLGRRR